MADSRLCKLSFQLIFVTLSWSTIIALSLFELAEEDCFGHAYVFHPCDVANPAQLHLKQNGLYAGQAGSLEDFFVRHVVLPFDAKDGAQAALVNTIMIVFNDNHKNRTLLLYAAWLMTLRIPRSCSHPSVCWRSCSPMMTCRLLAGIGSSWTDLLKTTTE